MYSKEQQDLWEAYQGIYEPQEAQELTEEVEIAAQYFYEMGLNEEGVEILIEELGVEEFGEFVYDIAEEYYLTEARAGGVKVEPVTAKGGKFKGGKPTGKSLERLRAKKAARREAEEKASEAKPSGLKSSLQRQSAVASAKKQQPKKKGVLDRVAGAVLKGMERHNKAMGELKKMKAATAETAGKVKKAAGEFKKGFVGEEVELEEGRRPLSLRQRAAMMKREKELTKAAMKDAQETGEASGENRRKMGKISSALMNPKLRAEETETDLFDTILEYLVAEGYADTNQNALVIMANMSEEWRQSILDEAYQEPRFGKKDYIKKLSKRGGMGMGTPEDPHGYRDPKMAKVGAEFSKRKTAAAKAKKTGEPDSYRAEKEAQSKRR